MILILILIIIISIIYFCWDYNYNCSYNYKEKFSQEIKYNNENFTSFIPTIIITPKTHIVTEPIGRGGFLVSSDQPNV